MPADTGPATDYELTREPLLLLFGDGDWHLVEVRSRRKDWMDRDVIDIEWHIAGDTCGGSYLCDPQRMRPVLPEQLLYRSDIQHVRDEVRVLEGWWMAESSARRSNSLPVII